MEQCSHESRDSALNGSDARASDLPELRVHLTNVTAPGPVQVALSLLPALESCNEARVSEIYLPAVGALSRYSRHTSGPPPLRYARVAPKLLSRVLECTLLGHRFNAASPILVLGDIPIACDAPQVVLVQTTHMCAGVPSPTWRTAIKHAVARILFRLNAPRALAFIVQTNVMKRLLEDSYPAIRGRVVVIPHPPPAWLLDSGLRRTGRSTLDAAELQLFYPADGHGHKNHGLLARIDRRESANWPIAQLTLTIPAAENPNPDIPWIDCVGLLSPEEMVQAYAMADALVFLSSTESYGLPLVEAMHVGLPIVAPDLPYARALCGDAAIYFDGDRIESLQHAIATLRERLANGWWPDWRDSLAKLPHDWTSVARAFVRAATTGAPNS